MDKRAIKSDEEGAPTHHAPTHHCVYVRPSKSGLFPCRLGSARLVSQRPRSMWCGLEEVKLNQIGLNLRSAFDHAGCLYKNTTNLPNTSGIS